MAGHSFAHGERRLNIGAPGAAVRGLAYVGTVAVADMVAGLTVDDGTDARGDLAEADGGAAATSREGAAAVS